MDVIGDISVGDYEVINGNYGYVCGCMKVCDDFFSMCIFEVFSFCQLCFFKCVNDFNLLLLQ